MDKKEDDRFNHILSDPKFRRIPKKDRGLKIDKRFQSMFKDKKFKTKSAVDKRGRPIGTSSTAQDLKQYYELNTDEESSGSEEEETKASSKSNKDSLNVKHASDKSIPDELKKKLHNLKVDYARGESALCSESSSDDEESEEELSDSDEVEHKWGELDADAERSDNITYRLAACNMDWDRIRAVDLMVLFNSFIPTGGSIKSVIIYPSEFGKQRMQMEEVKGPTELVENNDEDTIDQEQEEGNKYHMEKLRQYQLNRLKYYYAVITCDSENTANKIYTECDGMEYESSATKIDLRFIPDDITFDEMPKEVCDKLPEPNKYQPRFFITTALQQAKVDLTWDETDPSRNEVTQKLRDGKIDDVTDTDLQAYLALSSDEEVEDGQRLANESEDDDPVQKYKALLQEIEKKDKKGDDEDIEMEITWDNSIAERTEKLVKQKIEKMEKKTPFQEYLDKRKQKLKEKKEKKKHDKQNNSDDESDNSVDMNDPYFAEEFNNPEFKSQKKSKKTKDEPVSDDDSKKAELELLVLNENDAETHSVDDGTSSKRKKGKRKNKQHKNEDEHADEFQVNVNDERFSALFNSHHYNVDPTDPHFKKTKGMEAIISEKLKRRKYENEEVPNKIARTGTKKDAELSVLVKSVKRKAEAFYNKK